MDREGLRIILITVVLLVLYSLWQVDRVSACTDYESFFKELDEVGKEIEKKDGQSWLKARRFFSKHAPGCDDGVYSEGFSAIVTDLLANKWRDFDQFLRISESDKQFYIFALEHIDETVGYEVLEKILRNAKENCPPKAQATCSEIRKRAQAALQD